MRRALAAAGIARPGLTRRHRRLGDRDWLRLRYLDQQVSAGDIAAELGCHQSAVYKALEAAGIRRGGRTRVRRFARLDDHAWLRRRYVDDRSSLRETAAEIGCSPTAVRKALAQRNITRSPRQG